MNLAQLKTIQQNFVKELQDASIGKKTSLPFIAHSLSSKAIVGNGEIFQVLVIGGTMGKMAVLKKTINGIKIIKKKDEKRLVFKDEEDFLAFIAGELIDGANTLALNFAYPIKPIFENRRLDGVLLAVTKEGSFHGMVGKKIGEEIERYIFKKRKKRIIVSVANDTICLLLAGLTNYTWDILAGGVDGTGLNFAFFLDKEKAVNLESANFDKFPQTKEGKMVDRESAKVGRSLFEKEISGAYLYKHFNLIIKGKKIKYPQISSTEELDSLCHPELVSGSRSRNKFGMTDRQVRHDNHRVSEIAQNLLKRSAQLVACQIAGIVGFKKRDMVFNMEGSLFWKGNGYKETVERTVGQLVPEYEVQFVEIKDSAILGAAKLVA